MGGVCAAVAGDAGADAAGSGRPGIAAGLVSRHGAAYLAPDSSVLLPVHHKVLLYLAEQQTDQSGHSATMVQTPFGPLGLEICFDSCCAGMTRETVQRPAPPSRGHAAVPGRGKRRSVCPRRLQRSVADCRRPRGIVAQSPLFRPDVLVAAVPLGDGRGTFFTRWGDWLAYACLLVDAAALVVMLKRKRSA